MTKSKGQNRLKTCQSCLQNQKKFKNHFPTIFKNSPKIGRQNRPFLPTLGGWAGWAQPTRTRPDPRPTPNTQPKSLKDRNTLFQTPSKWTIFRRNWPVSLCCRQLERRNPREKDLSELALALSLPSSPLPLSCTVSLRAYILAV